MSFGQNVIFATQNNILPYFSFGPRIKPYLGQKYSKLSKFRKGDVPFCDPSFETDNKSIYKSTLGKVVRWIRPEVSC